MASFGSPDPYPIAISEDYGKVYINCVPCSGVVLAQVASHGTTPATYAEAQALRTAINTNKIPLGPADLAKAFRVRYGWSVPPFDGSINALISLLRNGYWGAVDVIYSKLPAANRHSDFTGGHCFAIGAYDYNGSTKLGYLREFDPLVRPGTGYRGEWIKETDLIKALYLASAKPLANLVYPNEFHKVTEDPMIYQDGPVQSAIVSKGTAWRTGPGGPVTTELSDGGRYVVLGYSADRKFAECSGYIATSGKLEGCLWVSVEALSAFQPLTSTSAAQSPVTEVDLHFADGHAQQIKA